MSKVSKEDALKYHSEGKAGKIEVIPTKPYSTQRDLSLAYTPGVAEPCLEIEQDAEKAYEYTAKGNLVAVISNGTAVLGLGDIGALAGKPVMEGKGLLFKIFAGIDVFDIEVNEKDPDKFIAAVKAISPTFGGINLEDIKAPECFEIETRYMGLGIKKENIVMVDSKGVISTSRTDLSPAKKQFATERTDIKTLADAMRGADIFLGLSVADVLTTEMVQSMNEKPIVFALANPNPEISYDKAMASRKDLIFATGRSDYPNQINNVLGFPYIFRGALDVRATAINEEMKLAATYAIAKLTKEPVPDVVNSAYGIKRLSFGPEYIIPKALDPRLLTAVAPAVAKAAMDSGVAQHHITDWDAYNDRLKKLMGYDNKMLREFTEMARKEPKRVVFAEANHANMLQAASTAMKEGICKPILLGNDELIGKLAESIGVDLSGMQIINLRHPNEEDRRIRYAQLLTEKRQREGMTYAEAHEKMFDRNYFGMMMVEAGEADAFITGTYSKYAETIQIAKEVIGIREGYKHFGAMHIMNTKCGTYFLADTLINRKPTTETLIDIAKLSYDSVRFFAKDPVIAMVSYSNFGSDNQGSPLRVHEAIKILHEQYPEIIIDGEMQMNFALNNKLRDKSYPFNKLKGREVNTIVFPNLSSANSAYKMMLEMGVAESIGPIQMGLNKPIHFTDIASSTRDIVNLTTVAVLDAIVQERRNKQ